MWCFAETFSPTSNSLYTHSPLPYDRMPDYRSHRVPPLQPPSNMSSSLQSQGTSVSGSTSILGRTDGYPATYTLHRGPFPPPSLSSLGEINRMPSYTATPRALESSLERTQPLYLGPGMLMDPVQQRLPPAVADAPPFNETCVIHTIVSGAQSIKPEIQAKIHKGFFQVDDKWTCYRRNYFSVSCSFSLHPWPSQPLYVKFSDQATERVLSWSMSISAIVNAQIGESRELVQHTPKRDKQSERKPAKVVLQPSQPPPLVLGHGASSNSSPHSFSLASQSSGMSLEYSPYTSTAQPTQPPTQHTFERIQFQKATANNGKRRAQQQYYNLVVELYAEITSPVGAGEPTQLIKIARRLSHPMVVRGRSPGHYKDGRRDSSTSMGPDGGSGGSGDGSGGAVLHSGLGSAARLALMPYDPSQRNGPHYGRTDYHGMTASDQSPLSESPHIPSSSSSGFDIGLMNDNTMDPMDSMKSTASMDSYLDANFTVMNNRKPASHFRHQLPSFDYDPVPKPGEETTSHAFPETYDPLVPLVTNGQHESPHSFLKQPSRLASHMYQHSSSSGYDPIYSAARATDGTSYGRFHNSQSLCV
ncbi:NDT80 / PhoG like DNA-binding family protein [Aspergillus ibericus CBS 121593]|uniref:PhoG like DNA-binding family protein n=1 Tax=Aspergillus ibericus CBS 121593 TaxID=1448316 RepID=A0A395H721_9EURO|nr:PhoG like DNA-binding family protein [Aspergillus ibericus CBS 121593]RAL03426.1 PhoG like DNA-binding family protein [Aspergillus ibericus CBS 121593]